MKFLFEFDFLVLMFRFCLFLYVLLIYVIVCVLFFFESSFEENGFYRYVKSEGEFEVVDFIGFFDLLVFGCL